MSRCKFCRKPIKWIEVAVDTDRGPVLRARPFNPRKRGEPYRPHDCQDHQGTKSEREEKPNEPIDESKIPWWLRD